MNIHRNELAFLGPGLPLYLEFILLSTIMLILLFLTFGIWALYTNIQRNFDCQNENVIEMQCSDYVLNIISFSSKKTDLKLVMIQNEMCLATTIFLIIVLQYFRIIQQKTEKKCDDTLISPSDYTLLIENITDKEGFDEVELKKTMEKHWNDLTYDILKENNKKTTFWLHYEKHYKKIFLSKFEIVKMVEAFKIDDFISFERKREKLNKKKRKKIWQIKKKLIENNIKNETLISISKKYFETNIIDKFLTNLNLDNLKKEFEEELNIFIKNRKKIQKITKKFSQMKEIEILWKNLQEKTENMVFDKKCPIILVTLNYQERKLWLFFNYNIKNKDAEILSEKYRSAKTKKFCSFFKKCLSSKDGLDIMSFKEKFLSITRAPEPSDILWENLEYSKGERRKFQIYSFLFSCLYLILSFAFLISFIYGNRRLEVLSIF